MAAAGCLGTRETPPMRCACTVRASPSRARAATPRAIALAQESLAGLGDAPRATLDRESAGREERAGLRTAPHSQPHERENYIHPRGCRTPSAHSGWRVSEFRD
jgi:hypothetical protein